MFAPAEVGTAANPVCAPGADAGCVPLNIFTAQSISPAALKFLQANSFAVGNTTERVASLAFTGKLGDYGIKSPWATEGVGVALGAEYRREHLDATADFLAANGLVDGNGAASPPVNGGFVLGIKAFVFGLIISIICCKKGFNASGGARGVGEATAKAVVASIVVIFAADYVLTTLLTEI